MGPISPAVIPQAPTELALKDGHRKLPSPPGLLTAKAAGALSYVSTAHLEFVGFTQAARISCTKGPIQMLRTDPLLPFRNGALSMGLSMNILRSCGQIVTMSWMERQIRPLMPESEPFLKATSASLSGLVQAALTIGPTSLIQQMKLAQAERRKTSALKLLRAVPKKNLLQFLFGNYGLVAARDAFYAGIFYSIAAHLDERFSKDRSVLSTSEKFGFGILSAVIAGGLAIPVTQPFQVALTHAKIHNISGNVAAIKDVIKKYGLRGLFSGLLVSFPKLVFSAATVGAVLTAGSMLDDFRSDERSPPSHISETLPQDNPDNSSEDKFRNQANSILQ